MTKVISETDNKNPAHRNLSAMAFEMMTAGPGLT